MNKPNKNNRNDSTNKKRLFCYLIIIRSTQSSDVKLDVAMRRRSTRWSESMLASVYYEYETDP